MLTLPRLPYNQPLLTAQRTPEQVFQIWWNTTAKALEDANALIEGNIADLAALAAEQAAQLLLIQQAQADIIAAQEDIVQAAADAAAAQAAADAAQDAAIDAIADAAAAATAAANAATAAANAATAAATAQSTANTAQSTATTAQSTANTANSTANTANNTANTVYGNTAIQLGEIIPGDVLTASDAGTTATISIAAHVRRYGDTSEVNVNAGSVTGLSFSTVYYVYYTDASRTGGSKTYQASTNYNTASPNKATGRHYVGKVTTPADGGGTTTGGANPPAGGGGVDKSEMNIYD